VPGLRKHETIPLLPHLPSSTNVPYLSVTIFRSTRTISYLFHSDFNIVIKTTLLLSCKPPFCSIFYVDETCISETSVRFLFLFNLVGYTFIKYISLKYDLVTYVINTLQHYLFSVPQQANSGLGRLVLRFLDHTQLERQADRHARTHTHTHIHTQQIEFLWSSDQLVAEAATYQHKTKTKDEHPYRQRDSKSWFQQSSGCRLTPWTARLLGSATTFFIPNVLCMKENNGAS